MKVRRPEAIAELKALVQLSPDEAIERLTYIPRGDTPAMALVTAVAYKEDVTARLLEEIALTPAEVETRYRAEPDENTAYFLHPLAMYLLGLFEEPRAWPLILEHFAEDPVLAEKLADYTITEALGPVLARCYDGTGVTPLMVVIENDTIDAFVRNAYLVAYHGIVLRGRASRSTLIEFVSRLLDTVDEKTDETWVELLASAATDLKEPSLRGKIEGLFDRGLIVKRPPFFIAHIVKDDIDWIYGQSDEKTAEDILRTRLFDELVDRICQWPWFQAQQHDDDEPRDAAEREWGAHWGSEPPYVRDGPKIGRNDLCPCGSGRKYKKCCLDRNTPGVELLKN